MFARKRENGHDPQPFMQAESAAEPAAPAPNPWAEKALAMFGISTAELQQKGQEIRAILDDYRDRLTRLEAQATLTGADIAEILEILRDKRAGK